MQKKKKKLFEVISSEGGGELRVRVGGVRRWEAGFGKEVLVVGIGSVSTAFCNACYARQLNHLTYSDS